MNPREQYQKETGKSHSCLYEGEEALDISLDYVEWLEKKLEKSKSLNDLYGMGVTEWKTKASMMTPEEIAEYREISKNLKVGGFNKIS